MNDDQLNNLPSIQGYFNWVELRRIVLATVGATTFTEIGLRLLQDLLSNADKIYIGPSGSVVLPILSILAGLLTARRMGKKYAQTGSSSR